MPDDPRWLRAVLRAERTVADRVNRISNSSEAAGLMLLVADGRRLVRAATDGVRSSAVHALSLPTKRDVDLLAAQVERLQRTLEEMAAEAREAAEAGTGAAARRGSGRATRARKGGAAGRGTGTAARARKGTAAGASGEAGS